MRSQQIGKIGEAKVIVDCNIPHDTIYISPKEEKMFIEIMAILGKLKDLKSYQELIAEPIIKINKIMDTIT